MRLADVEPVAKLTGATSRTLRGNLSDRSHHRSWVAEVVETGRIVGHARCVHFTWGLRTVPRQNPAPEGWYFMGA